MPKKTPIIVAAAFILAITLLLAGCITQEAQQVVGSSVLGLQQVQYFKSSSECFDSSTSKLWLYTLRGGGLGQWAEGEVTPSDVAQSSSGKEVPEKTLKIDSKYNQYCEYSIVKNNQATQIYTLGDPIEWGIWGLSCKESDAINKCGSGSFFGKYAYSFTCFCMKKVQKTGAVGSTQNFANPSTRTDWTIEVEAAGQSYSEEFSSGNRIRGKVGDNVCAIWQGNSVTGTVCGLPAEDVRPAYINGKWYLSSDDKYQTYKIAFDSFSNTISAGSGSSTEVNKLKNDLNIKANSALNSRVNFGSINEPASLDGAKIVKQLDSLIQYPIISLYVKADWIGVVTPIPDPKIQSLSSECFGAGREGTIKAVIKNIGNERGIVDIYADCTNKFDVESKSMSFDAGEEKTVYLSMSATTDQEKLTGSCQVYADSIEDKDSSSVSVCVTGHQQCTKGEEWCEDSNAYQCTDPMKPSLKEDCKSKNQVCNYASDGKTFCESVNYCDTHPEDPKCEGSCGYWLPLIKLPDLFCIINNFIENFRWTVAIVLGILSALLAWLISAKIMNTHKLGTKKSKVWIPLITSITIGTAILFLAYTYFWAGVITAIIFLLIKFFI